MINSICTEKESFSIVSVHEIAKLCKHTHESVDDSYKLWIKSHCRMFDHVYIYKMHFTEHRFCHCTDATPNISTHCQKSTTFQWMLTFIKMWYVKKKHPLPSTYSNNFEWRKKLLTLFCGITYCLKLIQYGGANNDMWAMHANQM